jgi:hypothetical protein
MSEDRIKRIRHRRNAARRSLKALRTAAARYAKLVKLLNRRIKRLKQPAAGAVPGMNPGGWHPDAIENQSKSPLSWAGGRPKLVWHTTEGFGLPTYSGSHPHFTLNPKTGTLWQHVPIRGGAYALRNLSFGVETNRAHAIQVELIGFAKDSQNWSDAEYANIAKLARWIEKHAGVPRSCDVTFRSDSAHKVADYVNYTGHLGHQHVPENDHWDPGLLRIDKII